VKDDPTLEGDFMTEIAFALIIGFVLGLLVGFLMRSENRRYEADFSGHGGAEQ
jgi:NhaP-type Na+/H+ or K+/H+ antiporter